MNLLQSWPLAQKLGYPVETLKALCAALTEPFSSDGLQTLAATKAYWLCSDTIFVSFLEHEGSNTLRLLDDVIQHRITEAIINPEQEWPIGDDLHLYLSIIDDAGTGLYVLLHRDSPLLQELSNG